MVGLSFSAHSSQMPRRKTLNRHLPPCVYQKHGAFYLVKRNKWQRIGSTLAEALQNYSVLYEPPTGEVAALIQEALPFICHGKAEATAAQYKSAAKLLTQVIGANSLSQINQSSIAQVKVLGKAKPNMTNRVLTVARLVFNYAVEHGRMQNNPAIGVKRLEEGTRDRLPTPDEFQKVYDKSPPRLQVLMDLWRLTGQRVRDVMAIRMEDILEEGVRIFQDKGEKFVIVEWNRELRAAVDRAKEMRIYDADTLMHGRQGRPLDYKSIALQWDEACAAANVQNFQRRDLRAVAATEADRRGLNATALLGHTSQAMTKRYLRGKNATMVKGPKFG